jgi:hypothetical protein
MTTPPHSSGQPDRERDTATPDASQHATTPGVPPTQPPGHPGAYGYPGYGYPVQRPTNGFAIASLVLGILWVWWVGSILALIFGYVARRQIRERGQSGDGLAIAGIVLGWVGVGVLGLFLVGFLVRTVVGPV